MVTSDQGARLPVEALVDPQRLKTRGTASNNGSKQQRPAGHAAILTAAAVSHAHSSAAEVWACMLQPLCSAALGSSAGGMAAVLVAARLSAAHHLT